MLIFLFTLLSCSKQERDFSMQDVKAYQEREISDSVNQGNSANILQAITDMQLAGNLSKEMAAYHRAMTYFHVDFDYDKAAQECFPLLGTSFLKKDDKACMLIYEILSLYYSQRKQHQESIEYALRGQKLAKNLNDSIKTMVFAYHLIKTQVELGTGYYYDELERLIPVLEKSQDRGVKNLLAYVYSDEIEDLWDIEDYDRIIVYGEKCLQILTDLKNHPSMDHLTCMVASTLARSYLAINKPEKAAVAFEKARQCQLVKTKPGCYYLIGYYLETYQTDKIPVLLSYPEDTAYPYMYSWEFLVILQDLQTYYATVGQSKMVEQTGMRMDVVRDSIVHREHHYAAEKATIISELKLDEMREELKRQQEYQQYFIFMLLVLLLFSIYLIYRTYQEKKEKNRKILELSEMYAQSYRTLTRKQDRAEAQIEADVPRTEFDLEAQHELLVRMDELIMKEKLYLLENVSREDMASMLHVDKTLLILAIRNHLNDAYMPVILNRYRVRHAIDVMKEQPNYTVEAIAKESGFNNVRKFYRIFKEEMGMTPTEYREVLKNKGEDSILPPPISLKMLVNQ